MALTKPGAVRNSGMTLNEYFHRFEATGIFKRLDSLSALGKTINDLPTRETVEAMRRDGTPKQKASTTPSGPPVQSMEAAGIKIGADPDVLMVGGALVKNVSFLVMPKQGVVMDVPIRPLPAAVEPAKGALLMAPLNTESPVLLFPSNPASNLTFVEHAVPVQPALLANVPVETHSTIVAAPVDNYVLSGDLEDFWGIKGLTAELYTYQSSEKGAGTREKVKLNSLSWSREESPLATLFPDIDLESIKKLRIVNIEFTYTDEEGDSLHPPGMRLEGDVELTGRLQPVAEMLQRIYGRDHAPSELHVSAYLCPDRDWKVPPKKISKLILDGSLPEAKFKAWDWLTFRSIGVEITALQVSKEEEENKKGDGKDGEEGAAKKKADEPTELEEPTKIEEDKTEGKKESKDDTDQKKENSDERPSKTKKTWRFGVSILGTASITNLPKATKPLIVTYRMARDPREEEKPLYNLVLTGSDWKDVYGVKNLTLSKPKFTTSFEAGSLASTFEVDVSATLSLADISLDISGKLSKEDCYLDGKVGKFTYQQLMKVYAQIRGDQNLSVTGTDAAGNNLEFDEMHLRLSRDTDGTALELSGRVKFNEHVATNGLIKVGTAGLTITGDIADFTIKDTSLTVKEAALDIEVGCKPEEDKGEDGKEDEKKDESTKAKEDPKTIEAPQKKTSENTDENTEAKEDKINKALRNRKSKFSVTGIVEFSGRTIKVGMYTERQAKSKEREWLVYGVLDRLDLYELFHDLKGSQFNWTLRNVAFLAASQEYEETNEINVLGYDIHKGVSLCASITPPEQIKDLQSKKDPPFSALTLAVTYSNETFTVSLDLPPEFAVDLPSHRPVARLEEFNVGLKISKEPELALGATLKIFLKDQAPLKITGSIEGGPIHAGGSLYTNTPWKNPFGLNERLTLSDLGVMIKFAYATVLEVGPSELGLSAKINIDKFEASAKMVIGSEDEEMLSVDISEINVAQIIRFAGKLTGIEALKAIEDGHDFLTFQDAKIYFSTGVVFQAKLYPRGIIVSGKMKVFDKKGDFHANIDDKGVNIHGAIDNFAIGGLEVRSATTDGKQATLDVEMTEETQEIKINGMISYNDIKILVLVNVAMLENPALFDAHLLVEFTEKFTFDLLAEADIGAVRKLSEVDLEFTAIVKGDLLDLICTGVHTFLDTIKEAADKEFEQIENEIKGELATKAKELARKKETLEQLKIQAKEDDAKSQQELQNIIAEQQKLQEELGKLKQDVTNAKANRDEAEKKLRNAIRQQKQKRDQNIQRKREEYNQKLKQLQQQEQDLRIEKSQLDREHESQYGPLVRAAQEAEKDKAEAETSEKEYQEEMNHWQRELDNSSFPWDKANYELKLRAAEFNRDREALAAKTAFLRHIDSLDFMLSVVYKALKEKIDAAANELEKVSRSVQALLSQGVTGFIAEVQQDGDEEVRKEERKLDILLDGNSKEQQAIREAQKILDDKSPDIFRRIHAADDKIRKIHQDTELKVVWNDYNSEFKAYKQLESTVHGLEGCLQTVRENFDNGIKVLYGGIEALHRVMPRIIKIEAQASSGALKEHKPIFLTITAVVADNQKSFRVHWRPNSKFNPSDLYKTIGDTALKLFYT